MLMIGIAYGVDQSLEKLIGNNQKIQLHSLPNQTMVTELYQLFPGLNVAQLGGSLYGFSADHRANYYTGHRSGIARACSTIRNCVKFKALMLVYDTTCIIPRILTSPIMRHRLSSITVSELRANRVFFQLHGLGRKVSSNRKTFWHASRKLYCSHQYYLIGSELEDGRRPTSCESLANEN
nr:hypothetical protein Iba_chr13cCG13740 [Ipomoea batatas]